MADPEIMKLCASLVEDPAIRDVMLERILNEFQLARDGHFRAARQFARRPSSPLVADA